MRTDRNFRQAISIYIRRLALLILVVFIPHGIWLLVAEGQYKAEVELLRSQGYHVSIADYKPASLPDSQNAAPIYEKAFRLIDSQWNIKTNYKAMNTLVDIYKVARARSSMALGFDWASANQAAQRLSGLVPLVKEALSRPECRFAFDWQIQKLDKIRHHDKLKNLVALLSNMAIVDAHEGRMEQACHKIRLAFKVAQATKDEPPGTGVWTMQSATREANRGLRGVIRRGNLSDRQCDELNGLLSHTDYRPEHTAALIWERAKSLDMYQRVFTNGFSSVINCCDDETPGKPSLSTRLDDYVMLPVLYADGRAYLKWMSINIAMNTKPYPTAVQLKSMRESAHDGFPSSLYSMVGLTASPNGLGSLATRAETALTQILLAAQRYRARHGQYPETMAQVRSVGIDDIPMDPFSDKDFIYKRTAKGFTVYSVGPDFKDDGGVAFSSDYSRRDIMLYWEE